MTTRYEDARSIIGDELANKVERLFQEKKIERTDAAELIIKSLAEAAEKIERYSDDWKKFVENFNQQDLLQLLYKLADDGKIEVDALAATINAMLNNTTDKANLEYEEVLRAAKEGDYGTKDEAGYADPGYQDDKKPRYPLKVSGKYNEEKIRAAWNYINQEKNAAKYSPEQVTKIKNKIIAAWKETIDPAGPPSAKEEKSMATETEVVEKAGVKCEKCGHMNATDAQKCEKCNADMTTKKDMGEPDDVAEVSYWQPYGGATTLADAQKYLESLKLEDAVYRVFNIFMNVASNVMASNSAVQDKMAAMSNLLDETRRLLTPDALVTFSTNRPINLDGLNSVVEKLEKITKAKDNVTETKVERTALNPIVERFNTAVEQALTLKGEERQMALQNILNQTGNDFSEVHRNLLETEITDAPVLQTANSLTKDDVLEIVRSNNTAIQNDLATLAGQLGELTRALNGLQVSRTNVNVPQTPARPAPVQKSITIQTRPPVQRSAPAQNNQPAPVPGTMSIADIARNTVFVNR